MTAEKGRPLDQSHPIPSTVKTWAPVLLALAATTAILVAGTAAGIGAGALFDIYNRADEPRAFAAGEMEAMTTVRLALLLLAFQAVVIAGSIVAARRFAHAGETLLPFSRPRGGAALVVAAAAGLLALAALFAMFVYVVDRTALANDLSVFSTMMRSRAWWLMLIAAGIGAPLAEEMLFRGFLFGVLRRSPLGLVASAVVTSAVWAVLHPAYSLYGVTAIALIGIYLALLRERTASLVPPMACHAAYNTLIVLALAFAPDGALPG